MTNGRPLIIRSYLSSLPKRINGEEKVNALTFFVEGAAKCGDNAVTTISQTYEPCDVGVIIGNAFASNPTKINLAHYKVREMVINEQQHRRKYWVSIDSNVFIYKDRTNPHKYLRYSFNGVFPATGIYCNDRYTDENWNNMKRDYGMDLKPWRTQGNHILVTLQRPLGWSMRGFNLETWLEETITKIRSNTDRPIVMRWHPGNWKEYPKYANMLQRYNVTISPEGKHITEDLVNCWALVCHNSTPSAVATIEGIPAFITDHPGYSQAGDMANTDFSRLENPNLPDREVWIRKLAQCHWSFEDLRSGRCWAHMRQWVKTS